MRLHGPFFLIVPVQHDPTEDQRIENQECDIATHVVGENQSQPIQHQIADSVSHEIEAGQESHPDGHEEC